jgi:hypothetical protein
VCDYCGCRSHAQIAVLTAEHDDLGATLDTAKPSSPPDQWMSAARRALGLLGVRGWGTPVTGLRWAVAILVATAGFGVVYAFDRTHDWFVLQPTRVLAHAHLGLIGTIGLAYVAVTEKLWPMFLLAHRPGRSPAAWAVRLIPAGVILLVPGLLWRDAWLARPGAVVVVAGLACHLWSLARTIGARRRRLELLHGFVLTSAAFLVAAALLAGIAGLAAVSPLWRLHLVEAEIAALAAWLGLAVIGHAHKIVPFMAYNALRARGVHRGPGRRPLMFSDLYDAHAARATFAAAVAGFTGLTVGLPTASATASAAAVGAGGLFLAATGVTAAFNLGGGPRRARITGGLGS